MNKLVEIVGNTAAVLGILVCVAIGAIRLTGNYFFLGHEPMTWFTAGIALMVMACLAKLHVLNSDNRRRL